MKSMSRRQFSRHFAGRSVSVLPPVNLRYLADSSRTLHSHSSMICQVSNCHGHERTSSNESCLGQMNDTRVKQNNANDDYYNACDTETTLQTQNVLLTQSNKVNVIKQNYSKFSCLNKPSLGPNTV
uniref:Uncharacterized protein n=1 Tax=Spongospora subterranea TaxID=70186 RepID=A0A0H5RR65_9EUKA|eukprot:CRZ11214.1 hypothetical protein [Spongospora subterranea]